MAIIDKMFSSVEFAELSYFFPFFLLYKTHFSISIYSADSIQAGQNTNFFFTKYFQILILNDWPNATVAARKTKEKRLRYTKHIQITQNWSFSVELPMEKSAKNRIFDEENFWQRRIMYVSIEWNCMRQRENEKNNK